MFVVALQNYLLFMPAVINMAAKSINIYQIIKKENDRSIKLFAVDNGSIALVGIILLL